jgi:glycerol uptake facilitator-like aquaporin
MGGALTGASLNPARTVGPAVVAGEFDAILFYLVGIFGGGAVAGFLHSTFFKPTQA